jgi:hypothetical protein
MCETQVRLIGQLRTVDKPHFDSANWQLRRYARTSFRSATGEWLPLYEGKIVQAYNHRAAGVIINLLISPDQAGLIAAFWRN